MPRMSKYLPLGSQVIVRATLHHRVERNDEGAPLTSEWLPTTKAFRGTVVGVVRVRNYDYVEGTQSTQSVYLVARDLYRRAKVRPCDLVPLNGGADDAGSEG